MNASHSPTGGAKRKSEKPSSYSEGLFDVVLIIASSFLLAWLNLPTYASWLIVAACVVFIVVARLFRRN